MADSQASANGDSNDPIKEEFFELCRELNMDVESQDTAWASYQKIEQNYVLEVIFLLVIHLKKLYHFSLVCPPVQGNDFGIPLTSPCHKASPVCVIGCNETKVYE